MALHGFESYDEAGRLDTFPSAFVRDVLGRDVLARIRDDPAKGWRGFEAAFGTDLRRLVQRRLPGSQRDTVRDDAYQEICAGLVARMLHDGWRHGRNKPAMRPK